MPSLIPLCANTILESAQGLMWMAWLQEVGSNFARLMQADERKEKMAEDGRYGFF